MTDIDDRNLKQSQDIIDKLDKMEIETNKTWEWIFRFAKHDKLPKPYSKKKGEQEDEE